MTSSTARDSLRRMKWDIPRSARRTKGIEVVLSPEELEALNAMAGPRERSAYVGAAIMALRDAPKALVAELVAEAKERRPPPHNTPAREEWEKKRR